VRDSSRESPETGNIKNPTLTSNGTTLGWGTLEVFCWESGIPPTRHVGWATRPLDIPDKLTLVWGTRLSRDSAAWATRLNEQITPLDRAVAEAAQQNPEARLLMSQPGVGPITALAFVLTIGDVSRFARGKQVASYLGLIPREHSSAGHQRLGAISKQGNRFLRMLLVEAAQSAVRYDPEFRREYQHRCHSKPKNVAKVAAARKLAVRLYWMLRTYKAHPESVAIESSPRVPLVSAS